MRVPLMKTSFIPILQALALTALALFNAPSHAQGALSERAAQNVTVCLVAYKDYLGMAQPNQDVSLEKANHDAAKNALIDYANPMSSPEKYIPYVDKYQKSVVGKPEKVQQVVASCNKYMAGLFE